MGDGHFDPASFLRDPNGGSRQRHPPANSFAPMLVADSPPIMQDPFFNHLNVQEDFLNQQAYTGNHYVPTFPVPAEDELGEGGRVGEREIATSDGPQPAVRNPSRKRRGGPAAAAPELDDPREKKKRTDKKYRDRIRTEKEQMKQQLSGLRVEKGSLMQEIEQLRGVNGTMSQALESSAEQMKQLSDSHNHLKRKFGRQESFVEALLQKLAPSSDMMRQKQESEKLLLHQAVLSGDVKVVTQMFEEVWNENMKLKREKMFLEVKVEALCEKIHNDKQLS